jgi:GNAT superfamily N-acetyltransferase
MYDIHRINVGDADNERNAAFLAEVFSNQKLYTKEYIKWQYADHPFGRIIGYNAILDNEIAAHFVLQPFPAIVNGKESRGLLAFNSATKKDHQGKGLFMMLANKTIAEVVASGYEFITAVTNHNSVHAYTKRLGFQLVCQLPAKIGFGVVESDKKHDDIMFEKFWNKELLDWRLANPLDNYSFIDTNDKGYYSKTHLPFVKAFLLKPRSMNPIKQRGFGWRPSTLFIGLDKTIKLQGLFFNIPERLKPSPLFLVYRDLLNGNNKLDKEKVKFNLIDFDAY